MLLMSYAALTQYIRHTCKLVVNKLTFMLICLLLFYAIATVFQLYHGGDMMYEMRRRKPELTRLQTQVIFNHLNHTGMV